MVRIEEGATEPIAVYEGLGTTGLTDLFARVLRASDNYFLDWADMTFKAAGWTALDRLLTEVNSTAAPGLYELIGGLDTSAITNALPNATYRVISVQVPADGARLPAPDEIHVGQWVNELMTNECRIAVAYDVQNRQIHISAWLVYNGVQVTTPTGVVFTWHNEGGAVLFTKTNVDPEVTGPDGNGVYRLVTNANDYQLLSKQAYYVTVSMTAAGVTAATTWGVPTAG